MHLLCALYGLKQAALQWWRELKAFMKTMGFHQASSNAGVFIYKHPNRQLVITLVYVDDGLFLGADKALVYSKKCACLEHWECHDTGDVTNFLGMKVNKTTSCITINQKAYLKMVLERFDMHNAKITPTPILLGYVPQENTGAVDPVWHQKFQSVIGSLLYLMLGMHPDIAFMVIKISQFSANPSQDHLDKAMYIMRYLISTQDYHMVYDGRLNEGLIAHTDLDWAGNPIKHQSTTGFFASLASGIVCWQSRLQKTVVLSSTKAEYMAMLDTCQQIVWIQSLFQELGYNLAPTPICGDNQGLIFIVQSKNGGQSTLTFTIITYVSASKMAKCLSTLSLAMKIRLTCSQRTLVP